MARDPYQYFRVEARELVEQLAQGALSLERATEPDSVSKLLRSAHTLKGAARVVRRPEIAELSHAIEERLLPFRDSGRTANQDEIRALLALTDRIADAVRALDAPPPVAVQNARTGTVPPPPSEEARASVRVDIEETDALLRSAVEASVRLTALKRELPQVERLGRVTRGLLDLLAPRGTDRRVSDASLCQAQQLCESLRDDLEQLGRGLAAGLARLESELENLREGGQRLRLVPAQSLFPALERAVFDAASAQGKRVQFQSSGGEVRLDAHVLETLRDSLLHMVRNAVVHGLESPERRRAAGKSELATVSVEVVRRGNQAVFACRDDGRGIDVEEVRRATVTRGVLASAEAESMSSQEVLRALLSAGVSTSADVTELAGRGIGLDVVRAAMQHLKGEVAIHSTHGAGSTFELTVPISVASLSALVVEVGGAQHAIPLDSVRSTARVRSQEIARSNDAASLVHEGEALPFVPLSRLLRNDANEPDTRPVWSVVLVAAGGHAAALGVDRVIGTSDVIVRALPSSIQVDPIVAGAALDADGHPQLVFEPAALVRAAEAERRVEPRATPLERLPILVIDDSLTTRMLEQSILQSAGYEVELAIHAEQGLEKAMRRRYGLFVVDVEMEAMDGFEFVAKVRAEPSLREIPAILVTSRNAPEDKKRGERVGANAYIVKGEFEQGHLLRVIRSLIG